MVTFLAAVLFFTGLGGLSADEQITKGLTYERLLQGNWIQSQYEEAGYRIKSIFKDQDGKYRFDLEREGPLGTGYVVLEAGTVIFEAIPGTEDKLSPEMKSFLSKTGSVWESTSRFDFHEYMKLMPGNVYLLNFNRPVKAGDERMYRGVRIVVIMKGGRTNDGVKIREGPSTSHKPVDLSKYESFRQSGHEKGQTFIKKGHPVYVLGRTVEKEKIGEWNNYWFLVALVDRYMEAYLDADRGWAYGEFIDLPD